MANSSTTLPLPSPFHNLTFPPQPPTDEETGYTYRFPHLGSFLVMGAPSESYNCLGWAVQSLAFLRGDKYFDSGWDIISFLAQHGYTPTQDASLADIDVWDGKWTSKVGNQGILVHERGALVSPDLYGTIIGHFRKVEGEVEVKKKGYDVPYAQQRCLKCTGSGHEVSIVGREVAKKCLEGYREEEEEYVLKPNRREE
ncbi:hypothetical protein DL546_007046 [Coniochaeta pulveracea]|uniref:Uncharacterized protein n=1 Tax=Coniochaeta pulveracea TaxID=177199 RepID=A0A420Y8Q9_9PEZI|nr:hypothetical protein DL546_007046 [Coniochaeta pulveracea]